MNLTGCTPKVLIWLALPNNGVSGQGQRHNDIVPSPLGVERLLSANLSQAT